MMVQIRQQTEADTDVVRSVTNAAFSDDGKISRLLDALHYSGNVQLGLVAEADGVVVGHTQLNRSWVDGRARLTAVSVLSPLSVQPSWQRQGVGAALAAAAIAAAAERGFPAVFVEGDPGYYGRLGFVAASEYGFSAPSVRVPDQAFQVVPLAEWEPGEIGALVYCEPFWSHDCVGLRDPALAEFEAR